MENHFEERYKTGDTPWNHGTPDANLINIVIQKPISKYKALDIGCGTGGDAIWLTQQQFVVTGCDFSQTVIEKAKEKATIANVNCSFITADFFNNKIPDSPFGFVFDRAAFILLTLMKTAVFFAEKVFSLLE